MHNFLVPSLAVVLFAGHAFAACSTTAPGGGNVALLGGGGASLLALRLGDGSGTVGTAGSIQSYLDEVSIATGAVLQTWVFPTGTSGGCVQGLTTTANSAGYSQIGRSTDGAAVFIPCYMMAVGSTAPGSSVQKAIWRADASGTVAQAATWSASGTGTVSGCDAFPTPLVNCSPRRACHAQ